MQQFLYHDFAVEEGKGPVLLGKRPEELSAQELREIVGFACVSAGLSTTKAGGISSVPEYKDVVSAMERI